MLKISYLYVFTKTVISWIRNDEIMSRLILLKLDPNIYIIYENHHLIHLGSFSDVATKSTLDFHESASPDSCDNTKNIYRLM